MKTDEYERLRQRHNCTRVRAKPRHRESELQRACVQWFRAAYPRSANMLFAVPNGGRRSPIEARIMKGEGVVAGVADLLLLVPRGGFGALCIEMKTDKGKQTALQEAWERLTTLHGNRYIIVRSLEQFITEVRNYLSK